MKNKEKRIAMGLFFLSLILIKLPPFYMLPPLKSTVLGSHSFAKILLLVLSAFFLIKKRVKLNGLNNIFLILFVFFLTQSLSVLGAKNIVYFWKQYQNVVFGLTVFFISYFAAGDRKNFSLIDRFIYLVGVFVVLVDLFYMSFSLRLIPYMKGFLQKEMLDLYLPNLSETRHNLFLNTELFVPVFVWSFMEGLKNKKYRHAFVNFIFIDLIVLTTFASKFRTRFFQLFFAFLISFVFFKIFDKKNIFSKKNFFISGLITVILLLTIYLRADFGLIKRLAMVSDQATVDTAVYRIETLIASFELLKKSPLVGVGLGNYRYYIDVSNTIEDPVQKSHYQDTLEDAHSLIGQTAAETGVIGLLGLLFLVTGFIRRDYILFKKNKSRLLVYTAASWVLFFYGLANPFNTLFLTGWFWFLRGLIEGESVKDRFSAGAT